MRKTDVWKNGKKAIAAIAVFAMVFSVFVGMNALNGKAEVFETNVQVSDSGYAPDVAVDSAGNIYVVWEDSGINCAKSTTGGASFGVAVKVSTSGADPAVAAYGENNVYVAWEQDYKIYYARSTNGGTSFEAKVLVSDAGGSGIYNENPDIAVDSNGVIYVVWAYDTGTDYTISIDKSTDGATFGTDVRVDDDTVTVVEYPSIAIDSNNNILVAWGGGTLGHVSFAKSINGGASFSTSVRIDDSTEYAHTPSIGVGADGKIFVAWRDTRNIDTSSDIYAAVSSDGGANFGAGVKVNDDTTDTSQSSPSLAVHACGKVFVAWADKRGGADADIYFANSTNGGASFNTNAKVNDQPAATTYNHGYVSLAVGNDTEVYIVWQDARIVYQIYFSQAPDATWPNAVDDLVVVDETIDSITLNWTAPGDNFALGTAITYDIRYSTTGAITADNWASATVFSQSWVPLAGGSAESHAVTGLNNDTTYYFALKTADEIPNWSPLSNVPSGKTLDDWTPDAVIDLAASDPTSNSITLIWTAPGDNGNTGTAAEYDIRYNITEVNDTTWADAIQCTLGTFVPSEAGSSETFIVTPLEMTTTYYFALKTADDATPTPNWSPLSNPATNTTTANTPPVASNLVIIPTAPKTTDNLVATYDYDDAETDAESGTEIRWYKDDVLQTEYNDTLTVPSTATAKGQVWNFTVKPKDGTDFGDLKFLTVTIQNSVPVANFTIVTAGPYYPDAVITFNASVSTDPDPEDIVNYTWNVSPGPDVKKYGLEVNYTFTTLGTFNVILTVKDASDVTNTTTKQVIIEVPNQPPVANFTISAAPYYRNTAITFNASTTTDPDIGDVLNYTWNISGVEKWGLVVTHTFTALGTFNVTLTVRDSYGEEDLITKQITIVNRAPTASFTTSATEVEVGVEITFTSTSTDPDGDTLTYLWDFGDNTTSTGANPKHKYDKAGTYSVTLKVTDAYDATHTSSATTITVKEKPTDVWLYAAIIIIILIIIIAVAAVVMKKKKKPEAVPETEE